ncbi:MAG: YchJ family metal-binding protein [Polyangiales bacterium]|nr:SEC-C domain-containing protein [Myxococcales bacterium]
MAELCPCGSGRPYGECCGVYHAGEEPPTAEALMRSRFSAFAKRDFDYVWKTLHADHAEKRDGADRATWLEEIRKGTKLLRYKKLRVLDVSEGPDVEGYHHVLFHVLVMRNRQDVSFAEDSRFQHDGEGWRYVDGTLLPNRQLPKPIDALTFDTFWKAATR